ncbi:MAG: orotidine-5'-phosphate decarboxylase [Bacteroidales bacterium]|nr:orotidine-5'-phosphate decarboxylase [Bacteroidales bacterium]
MNRQQLFDSIREKRSFLCIGLDTDILKIPEFLLELEDPVFEFNKTIIEATKDFAVAYKPNIAFYESRGESGWQSLRKTIDHIRSLTKKVFVIADAKRGDIGNTAEQYARTYFLGEDPAFKFDAVTIAPYMGEDSVKPFLQYEGKWAIVLALTSNPSAEQLQLIQSSNGKALFEELLETSKQWGSTDNMMYVVGATRAAMIERVRNIVPDHFLLIPGVGAQGGNLEEVAKYGMNKQCGLLVNSSRGIIYASNGHDFARRARQKARETQQQMENLLIKKGLV